MVTPESAIGPEVCRTVVVLCTFVCVSLCIGQIRDEVRL